MTIGSLSLKVVGKSKVNGKNDTKCLKNAVKTAKKPILREKISQNVPKSASVSASRRDFGGCRHLWTAEEQLAAAKKGGAVKSLRNAILNDCARTAAANNRLNEIFQDALNEPDPEIANQKMQLAERAAKFIGATFDQSPDAKQKIEVDGKMDNTLEVKISEA